MKLKLKKVPFPEFDCYAQGIYLTMEPKEFSDHILEQARKALLYIRKSGKLRCDMRRLLIEYGKWSRNMNIILRQIINTTIPEDLSEEQLKSARKKKMQYKLAYGMWWNRTHYIETFRKGFFGQVADRKNIQEGLVNIRTMMEKDFGPEEVKAMSPDFHDLVERLSKKKELTEQETKDVLDGKSSKSNNFD